MVPCFPGPPVEPGRGLPSRACAPLLWQTSVGFSLAKRCSLCSPHRTDVPGPGGTPAPGRYRNWNPPLLGNLPEDFLRILPQQTAGTQVRLAAPASPRPGSTLWRGAPNPVLGRPQRAASAL